MRLLLSLLTTISMLTACGDDEERSQRERPAPEVEAAEVEEPEVAPEQAPAQEPAAAASGFTWDAGGRSCVAALAHPEMTITCDNEDEGMSYGCSLVPLGVDLVGDPQAPDDFVHCSDMNTTADLLFVVEQNGAIASGFTMEMTPARELTARFGGDSVQIELLVTDTSGEGEDTPVQLALPYDRAARSVGAAEGLHPIERAPER